MRRETRTFGRVLCILDFIKVLSYSVLRDDRNISN